MCPYLQKTFCERPCSELACLTKTNRNVYNYCVFKQKSIRTSFKTHFIKTCFSENMYIRVPYHLLSFVRNVISSHFQLLGHLPFEQRVRWSNCTVEQLLMVQQKCLMMMLSEALQRAQNQSQPFYLPRCGCRHLLPA